MTNAAHICSLPFHSASLSLGGRGNPAGNGRVILMPLRDGSLKASQKLLKALQHSHPATVWPTQPSIPLTCLHGFLSFAASQRYSTHPKASKKKVTLKRNNGFWIAEGFFLVVVIWNIFVISHLISNIRIFNRKIGIFHSIRRIISNRIVAESDKTTENEELVLKHDHQ